MAYLVKEPGLKIRSWEEEPFQGKFKGAARAPRQNMLLISMAPR